MPEPSIIDNALHDQTQYLDDFVSACLPDKAKQVALPQKTITVLAGAIAKRVDFGEKAEPVDWLWK